MIIDHRRGTAKCRVKPNAHGVPMRTWSVRRLRRVVAPETPAVRSNAHPVREKRKSVPAGTHGVAPLAHRVGEHVHSVGGSYTSRGLGHAPRVGLGDSAWVRGRDRWAS